MRPQIFLAVLTVGSLLAADADWKPKPDEIADASDPRFEAIRVYRDADVAMRLYGYVKDRQEAPGDEADLLVTDFQESFGARHILKPLDFLARYPDSALVKKLLAFQVEQTSGMWPPWKALVFRIFREHPKDFREFFEDLDKDQKSKLLIDVRTGFAMATDPDGLLAYRIPAEEREALEKKMADLGEGGRKNSTRSAP